MSKEHAWDYLDEVWARIEHLEFRSMKEFVLDVLVAYEFEKGSE